jgi:hypothetical protein
LGVISLQRAKKPTKISNYESSIEMYGSSILL